MDENKVLEYKILKLIIKMINDSSLETKKRVNEKINSHIVELSADPIGVITKCLNETLLEAEKELETIFNKDGGHTTDTPKTMTDNLDRGKAFVETMSSQARLQNETIQQRREERYEQMIEEAGEIESPANRLRN